MSGGVVFAVLNLDMFLENNFFKFLASKAKGTTPKEPTPNEIVTGKHI